MGGPGGSALRERRRASGEQEESQSGEAAPHPRNAPASSL
jgi:hypothetical protein